MADDIWTKTSGSADVAETLSFYGEVFYAEIVPSGTPETLWINPPQV